MGLEEIKGVAKDFAGKAMSKTGEVVELSKLRMELSKQEGRLRALYQQLGKCVYLSKLEEPDENMDNDFLDDLCEDIEKNLDKKEELLHQIAALKKMKVCPSCGNSNPTGSRYCNYCGSSLTSTCHETAQPHDPDEAPF